MTSWGAWKEIPGGGRTFSGPSAFGAVMVAARGTDNYVYVTRFVSGTVWTPWAKIPDMMTESSPCVGNFLGGTVVCVRSLDNRIYYSRQSGEAWGSWSEVPGGGRTPSAPAVAGNLLVVRGTDNGIHYTGLAPAGSWRAWQQVAGVGRTSSAPAVTGYGAGYLSVVRGTDGGIYYQSFGSDLTTSGSWRPVPGEGRTPSAPALSGSLLVVRGTDNHVYYNSFDGLNTWEGWIEVPGGGRTPDSPSLAHSPGYFTLVARGMDDGIYSTFLS